MIKEYEALEKNGTWVVVDRPKGKKIVESKWVLRTKYKSSGEVERREARLVAKGFTQRPGTDFNETFAPVARIGSIRTVMALAAELELEIHQLKRGHQGGDFYGNPQRAFENPEKEENEKYVGQKVCLLKKALYGSKQSGRQWYKKLNEKLKMLELEPLNANPCEYICQEDKEIQIVIIYVDDLIVASNNRVKLQYLKTELSMSFDMKDLGPLNFCLGIEFLQDKEKGEIKLSQRKYIKEVLRRFSMEHCKPVSTPMNIGEKLSKSMCPKNDE